MLLMAVGDIATDPASIGAASFFGFMGITCALVFASNRPTFPESNNFQDLGSAYGTAKSGIGISSMGVLKPELIMRSLTPVIMAGILGIYGLIVSIIIVQKSRRRNFFTINAFSFS